MSYGYPGRDTVFVCPSITFSSVELRKITGIQHYEERMLFMALTLRDPRARVIYATSSPIDPDVLDYYLGFLPHTADARSRLHLVPVDDPEPRALTDKILERPGAVARIAELIGDPARAYMLPFNVTRSEAALASALGVPLYGPAPELVPLGSKSGAREVARAAGVPVVDGAQDLWSMGDVEDAIHALARRRPDTRAVVIKLNNGFSGQGNAIVDLDRLRTPLERSDVTFCAAVESWGSFAAKIAAEGAVVEELVRGPDVASPSVQVAIAPAGGPEIVSTHDQILGGPDEQVYLGCRFPARHEYRDLVAARALSVAGELARRGVIGPFGMDFLLVPGAAGTDVYLSEINLRMGGTTHPFAMARLVTGGAYDPATGELCAGGRSKCYVATDNLKSDAYKGLPPRKVIDAIERAGLGFASTTHTGATLHLLGALECNGKLGVTCIEDSWAAAEELYNSVVATVDGLAGV